MSLTSRVESPSIMDAGKALIIDQYVALLSLHWGEYTKSTSLKIHRDQSDHITVEFCEFIGASRNSFEIHCYYVPNMIIDGFFMLEEYLTGKTNAFPSWLGYPQKLQKPTA